MSGSGTRLELSYLEEERVRVLARVDELKARLTELEQQLQENKQEVGDPERLRNTRPTCSNVLDNILDSTQTNTHKLSDK